jgi:hypothetical protein
MPGRVIENGLQPADALPCFTIWPAEILGVQNQLGSIEAGKIDEPDCDARRTFRSQQSRGPRFHRWAAGLICDQRRAAVVPARTNLVGAWSVNLNLGQGESHYHVEPATGGRSSHRRYFRRTSGRVRFQLLDHEH